MTKTFGTVLILGIAGFAAHAADKLELKDQKAKASYAMGRSLADYWKQQSYDVDVDIVATAIKEGLAGKPSLLPDDEKQMVIQTFQAEARQRTTEKRKLIGEANVTTGAKFREDYKKASGVKTTPSGLMYKVLTEGKGEIPKPTDSITAHYRGKLTDGVEFDSSYKRNQPFTTAVSSGIIKGWTEALQLMPVGSKWEVVLPPDLAYGERGTPNGPIGPNATLVFELELISILPRAGSEPVTSDIIKVPSLEEMKKGAQVEVLKKEDVERLQKEAAKKDAPAKK